MQQGDIIDDALCAGTYLVSLGHQRIECVTAPPDSGLAVERAAGLRNALADAGIGLPDSAIFAANDHMALGVIKGMRRARRRIPDDVSVIGEVVVLQPNLIIRESCPALRA